MLRALESDALRYPRELLATLGWALLAGLAAAVGPHTSGTRFATSLVGGVAVAGIVAGLRLRFGRLMPACPELVVPPRVWWTLAAAAFAFAPTIVMLYESYRVDIWENGHGLILPFVVVALARARLRRAEAAGFGGGEGNAFPGLALALLGVLLALFGAGPRLVAVSAVGLLAFVVGLSLLTLGTRGTRAIAAPLALCVFLVPLPTGLGVTLGLQELSAAGTEWLLGVAGLPVLRQGVTVTLAGGAHYLVSANCSGFSSFHSGMALAAVLAVCTTSRLRWALLLLAPWPLAISMNALRLTLLFAIPDIGGVAAIDTPLHGTSGIVAFWGVMIGVALLGDWRGVREALR